MPDLSDLAVPDLPPHVVMLIFAHVDLCAQVAKQFVANGMPKPQARQMLMDHGSMLRQTGAAFGFEHAAADIANGVEVFADRQLR